MGNAKPQDAQVTRDVTVGMFDYRAERGLRRSVMRASAQESARGANLEHMLGPSGVGIQTRSARGLRQPGRGCHRPILLC
jgi:hypothetical protein